MDILLQLHNAARLLIFWRNVQIVVKEFQKFQELLV